MSTSLSLSRSQEPHMKDSKEEQLQHQIDQLLSQNAQLQYELSQAKDVSAVAENKAQTLQARNNLLELTRGSTGKAHQEIIEIYEKQEAAYRRQLEEAVALDSRSQAEIHSLRQESDLMRKTLTKTEIQLLAIRKQQQRQGGAATTVAAGNEAIKDPHSSDTAKGLSGTNYNLAKVILAYEDEGKNWFNVYDELFDLREAHVKVLSQKENLHAAYQKLSHVHQEIQRELARKDKDTLTLVAEFAKAEQQMKRLSAENTEYKDTIKKHSKTIERKQQQIEDLQDALQTTSYQLRETLWNTELDKTLLPPGVEGSAELLEYANLNTDIDHNLLAFQSIDELQQRNMELLQKVRQLDLTLAAKISEMDVLKQQHKSKTMASNAKLEEACTHICQLKLTIDTLQEQLPTVDKTLLPAFKSTDLPTHRIKFGTELEAIEKDLDNARAAATASAIQAESLHSELDLCKEQYKLLQETAESRFNEMNKLQLFNGDLQLALNATRNALQQCQNDLAVLQTENRALTEEKDKLQVQLSSSEKLYEESRTSRNAREAHIDQMAALIRERTSKMDINNRSSLELIDYYKELIKSQQAELDSLGAELKLARTKLHELHRSSEINEQRLEEIQSENSRLREENISVLYEQASLNEKKAILELKVLKFEQELTPENLAENQKTMDDLAAAQAELQALNVQIAEYEKKLQENEDAMEKINQDRHAFALEMEAKFGQLQQALESYREREKAMETAAKEIQKIKDEKTEVEQEWQNERTAHAAEIQALQGKHEAQDAKIQELLQEIETHVSLEKELKSQLTRLREELDEREANDQTESLKQEIERLTKELSEAQQDLTSTKSQLESSQFEIETQLSQWQAELSNVRAELQAKQEETTRLTAQLLSAGSVAIDQHEDLLADITEEELRKLTVSLQHKYNEMKTLYDHVARDRDVLEQQLEKAKEESAQLQDTIKQMNEDTSGVQKRMKNGIELAKNEAEAYKNSNTLLRSTLAELEHEYANLKKRLASADAEAASEELEKLKKEIELAREKLEQSDMKKQQLEQKLQDILAEHTKQTGQLTTANALAKRFQNMAVTLKKRWELAEEKLKEQTAVLEEAGCLQAKAEAASAPASVTPAPASAAAAAVVARAASPSADVLKEKQAEIERLEAALKEATEAIAQHERTSVLYTKLKTKHRNLLEKAKQLNEEKYELKDELRKAKGETGESEHTGQKRPLEDENAVDQPQKKRNNDTQ